ncbi:MAG: hypothetical protein ACRD02_02270 [Acidimicrobiia bacterium]
MRPLAEFERAMELVRSGMNDCAIGTQMGIPRGTVRDWRHKAKTGWRPGNPGRSRSDENCPVCSHASLDRAQYAYLLGQYLGDGCLSEHRRRVFRLRISLSLGYPGIMSDCIRAIVAVRGSDNVGFVECVGCVVAYSYWKHWRCVFPQHGSGRKHERKIELLSWQEDVVAQHPDRLLRGLLHSDGWRGVNRVNGTDYPRYQFANNSEDILRIFCQACDRFGVSWKQMNWKTISIARAPDVLKLDLVAGPKA